jgi:hypothetical protein
VLLPFQSEICSNALDISLKLFFSDLKSYQEAVSKFNIPVVDERFEFLILLGKLFLLPYDAIKQYTEDNELGRVDISLLKPYLMQRSDWGTFTISGLESSLNSTGPSGAADGAQDASGGLMERFGGGRLGAMMRDLENLKIEDNIKGLSLPFKPTMPTMPSIPAMPTIPSMPSMATTRFGMGGSS